MTTTTTPSPAQQQQQQQQHLDYTLVEKIGLGSFATVYKAVRGRRRGTDGGEEEEPRRGMGEEEGSLAGLPQVAAIKIISKARLTKKLQLALDGEISILERILHPNIVRLFQSYKTKQNIYLVMEYCAGGDLHAYIRKQGTLPRDTTLHFMRELAEGLKYLWSQTLVHRDLKPHNLLLTEPGPSAKLKIADFGFARHLSEAAMADTLCGSPLYMAPEILRHERYDAKADLWSVGAILYEMLAGKPPFTGGNPSELLSNIERTELRVPRGADVTPETVELLKSLLRRNPTERISYAEFFGSPYLNSRRLVSLSSSAGATSVEKSERVEDDDGDAENVELPREDDDDDLDDALLEDDHYGDHAGLRKAGGGLFQIDEEEEEEEEEEVRSSGKRVATIKNSLPAAPPIKSSSSASPDSRRRRKYSPPPGTTSEGRSVRSGSSRNEDNVTETDWELLETASGQTTSANVPAAAIVTPPSSNAVNNNNRPPSAASSAAYSRGVTPVGDPPSSLPARPSPTLKKHGTSSSSFREAPARALTFAMQVGERAVHLAQLAERVADLSYVTTQSPMGATMEAPLERRCLDGAAVVVEAARLLGLATAAADDAVEATVSLGQTQTEARARMVAAELRAWFPAMREKALRLLACAHSEEAQVASAKGVMFRAAMTLGRSAAGREVFGGGRGGEEEEDTTEEARGWRGGAGFTTSSLAGAREEYALGLMLLQTLTVDARLKSEDRVVIVGYLAQFQKRLEACLGGHKKKRKKKTSTKSVQNTDSAVSHQP